MEEDRTHEPNAWIRGVYVGYIIVYLGLINDGLIIFAQKAHS